MTESEFFFGGNPTTAIDLVSTGSGVTNMREALDHAAAVDDQNRVKIVKASFDLIVGLMNWAQCPSTEKFLALPKCEEIPEGTEIVSVNVSFMERCLHFIIRHKSFPVCPLGAIPPTINGFFSEQQLWRRVDNPQFLLEKASP